MTIPIISGDPGKSWTNQTGKIAWQFHCRFANSCGRCIQLAGLIGPFWPVPIHPRCNCRSVMVCPGETAAPFVDYYAEVQALDATQQARVMGAANYRLVESGIVPWDEVVTRGRIRTLAEVVDRLGLTATELSKAGIPKIIATRALAVGQAIEVQAADRAREFLIDVLKSQGFSVDQIRGEVRRRLAARIGLRRRPEPPPKPPGPIPPKRPSPPRRPLPSGSSPTLAAIAKAAGITTVAAVARYLLADITEEPTR